ncbi:hypothetical protein SLA2020_191650 [Shorea laevis]
MNTNTASFVARVGEATTCYAALLESMNSIVAREQSKRAKIEEVVSRIITNSVACEGRDTVERCKVFRKCQAWMGMAGFGLKATASKRGQVNAKWTPLQHSCQYGFHHQRMGRTLTITSAWR